MFCWAEREPSELFGVQLGGPCSRVLFQIVQLLVVVEHVLLWRNERLFVCFDMIVLHYRTSHCKSMSILQAVRVRSEINRESQEDLEESRINGWQLDCEV